MKIERGEAAESACPATPEKQLANALMSCKAQFRAHLVYCEGALSGLLVRLKSANHRIGDSAPDDTSRAGDPADNLCCRLRTLDDLVRLCNEEMTILEMHI